MVPGKDALESEPDTASITDYVSDYGQDDMDISDTEQDTDSGEIPNGTTCTPPVCPVFLRTRLVRL